MSTNTNSKGSDAASATAGRKFENVREETAEKMIVQIDRPNVGTQNHLRCVSLAEIEAKQVQWLWAGRIPLGKLTLLCGDPGLGKSYITLDVAARVSTGQAWPDDAPAFGPATVLVLAAEDGLADTVKARLTAANADQSLIRVITPVEEEMADTSAHLNLGRDCQRLEQFAHEHDVRLIIIDPITAYMGEKNANASAEVRALLQPLATLASKCNCAVLAVTHLNKNSDEGSTLYRALGSIAWTAACRMVWAVRGSHSEPDRTLLPVKSNLAPMHSKISFRIGDDGVVWGATEQCEPASLGPAEEGAEDKAVRFLREWLQGGPLPATEMMDLAATEGISKRTLARAKSRAGVRSRKIGAEWEWFLEADAGAEEPS